MHAYVWNGTICFAHLNEGIGLGIVAVASLRPSLICNEGLHHALGAFIQASIVTHVIGSKVLRDMPGPDEGSSAEP